MTTPPPDSTAPGESAAGHGVSPAAPASPADAPEVDAAEVEDAEEPERGPLRRCIVTRESLPREAMLRFVLGPDRMLVPDLAARLPGRGIWLASRAEVLARALAKGGFARAARGPVTLPPDLATRIEEGLKGRIRDHLGFARRAGQAVTGFQAVREWLQAGRAALLVEAADGSLAERERLLGRRPVPVVAPLPAAVLGGIFGRENAVHVALASGALAERIEQDALRLAGLATM